MVFLITKSVCASVKLTEKNNPYVYTIMRKNSSCIWKVVSIPWSQTETTNHNIIQCTLLYHKLDRPLGTAAEVRSPFLSLELDKQVVSSHPCRILILFMILLHVSPISILRIWQMLYTKHHLLSELSNTPSSCCLATPLTTSKYNLIRQGRVVFSLCNVTWT